ncbi:MAG: APC family permease [Maricaulaceae bacterium]
MSDTSNNLRRVLGLRSAVFLGLGSILGTGVFVSIGIAAGITGGSVIAAIAVAALLAMCNAMSSAQLAAFHPVSGGTYEYGYRLLGPRFGFTAGWMFLLAKSASAASAALGVVLYAGAMFGLGGKDIASFLAAGIVGGMALLVASGLKRSNAVNTVIVSLTLLVLTTFIIIGSLNVTPSSAVKFTPIFNPDGNAIRSFLEGCALMFVAFTGYGRIATLGEEVKDPRRTIPRAILTTLTVSALLYMAVGAMWVMLIGADPFLGAEAALSLENAARLTKVPELASFMAIGAVIAMLGVLLNLLLGLSRVMLAMARRRDMPLALSKINAGGSPVFAVLAVGAIIMGLALIGDIKTTWSFSAFTVLIYYSITNLCALRQPEGERLYPRWVSKVGLVMCLGLATFMPMKIWVVGLALLAVGFIWHEAAQRFARHV